MAEEHVQRRLAAILDAEVATHFRHLWSIQPSFMKQTERGPMTPLYSKYVFESSSVGLRAGLRLVGAACTQREVKQQHADSARHHTIGE